MRQPIFRVTCFEIWIITQCLSWGTPQTIAPDRVLNVANTTILFAHLAAGGGYSTVFTLVNTGSTAVDGTLTGLASRVDFEDWEPTSQSRDVHFLWPSGKELSTSEESYLDDYVFLAPAGDLNFQVMYTNVTDGTFAPFIGMAVLVNP